MNNLTTHIRSLRLHGAQRQPVRDWLASAELQPASLPPQAILLVRQLRARGGWTSVNAAHHWSEATRASLTQLLQQAARPADGAVPEQVPAVLFADHTEMLACLCRDWLAGQTGHWWWRCLYPAGVDALRLYTLLLKHCLLLPALLQRLAQQPGLLLPLLLKLPLVHALRLVQTLALEYAVSDWPDLPAQLPALPGKNRPSVAPAPLWQGQIAAPLHQALTPQAELLLGVALLLAQQPQSLRQPQAGQHIAAWWQAQLAQRRPSAVAAPSPSPPQPRPAALPRLLRADLPALAQRPHWPLARVRRDAGASAGDQARPLAQNPLPSPEPVLPQLLQPWLADSTPPAAGLPAVASPAQIAACCIPGPAETCACVSDFGGLFYLINSALSLQLYGDFTQPRRPGIALPLWDWLALLGQRLLGETLLSDPLWPLLAQLAGRDANTPPGAGQTPPADWQPPAEWLPWHNTPAPACATLHDWLTWLQALLQARLSDALDCPPPQLARLLCCHRAQISVSEGRLDVTLRLDQLPIQIRIAGLDRDPGWLPAVGRAVYFHFEP
ncbi:MAG: hypothetical protein U1F55_04665 [Chitinivorax sp.]